MERPLQSGAAYAYESPTATCSRGGCIPGAVQVDVGKVTAATIDFLSNFPHPHFLPKNVCMYFCPLVFLGLPNYIYSYIFIISATGYPLYRSSQGTDRAQPPRIQFVLLEI